MTIAQESTNGHHHSLLPCSFPESQQQNQSKDSTDDNSNSVSATPHSALFAASAYHVPPKLYAPKADSFHDTIPDGLHTMKMPDRCQFMFSDGRQCTMARSDIHPSLCFYHADREEQLFGDPSCRCEARTLDFPELYSASRDLSTAAGVNRALAQVFRMLAQRRISRQEAATFAKLAHLLLQSIRAASQEQPITEIVERQKDLAANVYHPPRKGYPQDALFAANKVELRGANKDHQELSPVNKVQRECSPQIVLVEANSPAPAPALAASPGSLPPSTAANKSSEMNTSAAVACNSPEINTYKNAELNPLQNEHLRKKSTQRNGIRQW